jgi:hypothetical protein
MVQEEREKLPFTPRPFEKWRRGRGEEGTIIHWVLLLKQGEKWREKKITPLSLF